MVAILILTMIGIILWAETEAAKARPVQKGPSDLERARMMKEQLQSSPQYAFRKNRTGRTYSRSGY